MKMSVLLLFRSKLIWKLSFDDKALPKFWHKSERWNEVMEWSPSMSQTCGLTTDFKACASDFVYVQYRTQKLLKDYQK